MRRPARQVNRRLRSRVPASAGCAGRSESEERATMKMSVALVGGLLLIAATGASAQGVDDAQIAAIVVTANQVDIDAGKLASSMGSNAEVKKFGQQMATDHAGVNKQAVELVTKLKVTPKDNPTSTSLK